MVLKKLFCTEKFIRLVRLLHDAMECCVVVEDEQSPFFSVTVLAPTLFALYFAFSSPRPSDIFRGSPTAFSDRWYFKICTTMFRANK